METTTVETLNPQQSEIVKHNQGPALVIAGAGSGKTRVITFRVAKLVENGVAPNSILMMKFTNKAAKEMAERVAKTLGDKDVAKGIIHGTFHSVANKFLRRHAPMIGYERNFSILDDSYSQSLILRP